MRSFQNNDCIEFTSASDERTSLDHSGTHMTSLAEPFQDGGNEINFTQTRRLLSDKQT